MFVWSEDPELDGNMDMNKQTTVVSKKGRPEV